jgi:hypothetical protein
MYNHGRILKKSFVLYSPSKNEWYNIHGGWMKHIWEATRFKKKDPAIMWKSEDEEIFSVEETIKFERVM